MARPDRSAVVTTRAGEDLSELWVPLLRRLTERLPAWGLWKNADRALFGYGDFDSTAPERDWDAIIGEFSRWAGSHGYGPVAACPHVAGVLFIVALDRKHRTVLELDVNGRKYFRGWTMFKPEDLTSVMEIDDRGFRRVRPGAEGIILLTQNGLRWGGRPNHEGLRAKLVPELLAADPEGARAAARLFGPAGKALEAGAAAVAKGAWNRPAMLQVEAYALARALMEPAVLTSRLQARRIKNRCPLLRTIFADDREIRGDPDRWVRDVGRDHTVLADG